MLLHRQYEIFSAEQKEMFQSVWIPGNYEVRHSCARENVHQPSAIQSHGYILVMDKDTYDITQVSGNVTDLGYTYDDLFAKNLRNIIENFGSLEKIPPQVREFKPMVSFPLEFGVGDLRETFTAQFHVRGKWAFLEFERPVTQTASAQSEADITLQTFTQQLSSAKDIAEGCRLLTDMVQELTGHDRVMAYIFHPDWHGEVIAETLQPGAKVSSFRGLHFPEYDVPRQARACFIRNLYGYTPQIRHHEVQLVPLECPIHQDRPDMTLVSLQAKSPGNTQYYLNMGVGAVLHYSILVNGKLWGLVACHHCAGPKFVPFDLRVAVTKAVESFSIFVKEKEREKGTQASLASQPARQRILRMLEEGSGLRAALASPQSNILDVLECSGAAVAFGNKVHRFGTRPTAKQIQSLVEYVSVECKGWLCTGDLSQEWQEAMNFFEPELSCLAHCNAVLSVAHRVCVMWFPMPTDVEREWGGDPTSSYTKYGMRARVDFSPCLQSTSIPARPWSDAEQDVARALMEDVSIRHPPPGHTSGTDLPADCPDESSTTAGPRSPLLGVYGEGGPSGSSTVPPVASNEPRDGVAGPSSPSSRIPNQTPGGTSGGHVSGGGCWPFGNLFRNTDETASLISAASRSPNSQ